MGQGAATVRSVLVLWDVDHTLIENNGVSKKTYALAFELLTGRRAEYPAETDGRTDQEIMRNMLISNGIDPTDDQLACVSEALENAMSSNASELRDRGYALPGARAVLETLQRTSGIVQSVLSWNIAPNALIKLSVFDLNSYLDFDVGGYGSDDFVRSTNT